MALIHVYNGISEKVTYTFNGKLRDNLKGVNWDNCVILRGGYRISPDYEAQPDDIVYVRKTPGDPVTIAIVGGMVALTAGGVAWGLAIYNNNKTLAQIHNAEKASKAASETSNKLPFVKGARNMPATGRAFPFALGESLMTPYRLCPAHYTIAGTHGSEQYYNAVLEIAYNDILIKKVKMGEQVIKDFAGTTAPQNGQYSFDPGIYYDERNLIEIRQTGDFTDPEFNKKIILTDINTEIPHEHATGDLEEDERIEEEWKAGVVQELPTHAQSVEVIALFDGLQKYEDGLWNKQTVTLDVQWTNAENPTESDWVSWGPCFNQDGTISNTFEYNTKNQMRFVATKTFTAEQAYNKNIKIRVIRTTPKADASAKDRVYLMAVQTTCYDAKKSSASNLVTAQVLEPTERDKCCRIGVRIVANRNTDGQLDAISVIEEACARTWDGTDWSDTKTPTRNLAAWVLEVLTSDHHAPSKYSDTELDLASFGAWYEYCEAQGFYADGVITDNKKKKSIIESLCINGNASLVYNKMTGLMEVAIDNGRDYSIALLNSENIISISTTKEFKRKTDGKKVTYINAAAGYDADSVIFMRDGGSYDPQTDTLTEAALEYVTSYDMAYKIAWRRMAEEMAQPRVVTVKAGFESAYYPLYSRVELQHKSLKIGLANGIIKALVWRNHKLSEIKLDGVVTFPEGENCGVIINCVSPTGRGLVALKVTGSGTTDTLEVTTELRDIDEVIPTAGNALSFGVLDSEGEFTTITSTMKITNAEETDNGYTLTLVDYNPALYEYGTPPVYKSNLTTIPNGTQKTVEEQRPYVTEGEAQANASESAQAAVDTVTKGVRFTNVYKLRPVETCLEDIIAKMDDDARNASASISMSEDEILLQVDDMERELTGLISVQAGAVTALVEGGGATGQMSLTLNLPAMIDAAKRAELITASTEAKVNAVYALVEGTEYYAIKPTASNADVKALWDDAIAAGLIASQIDLTATQIKISGENIYINGATMFEGDVGAEKIKAALIETTELLAENISVKDNGVIHSDNYNGTISEGGIITQYGSEGWAIDHAGNAAFNSLYASGNCYFAGGLGEPEAFTANTWQMNPNGVYLIFCYTGDPVYNRVMDVTGYTASSAVNVYLFSGNFSVSVISGTVHRSGAGFLYKIRELNTVCAAELIHKQSTSEAGVNNYDYMKVTFTSTQTVDKKNIVTVLKIGNI